MSEVERVLAELQLQVECLKLDVAVLRLKLLLLGCDKK